MKKLISTIGIGCLGLLSSTLNAQTTVFNEKLFQQLTKNQMVRSASEKSFFNSYEKQKELYEKISKKTAQIVGIHEYIYNQLSEVNTALLHGKKLVYIYKDLNELLKISRELASISVKKKEYAILMGRFYTRIYEEGAKLKKEVTEEILNKNNDFLMDSYDRERLLNNISQRIINIKATAGFLVLLLKEAEETPYIYHIPEIRDYANIDKMLIREIIDKYKIIKYY